MCVCVRVCVCVGAGRSRKTCLYGQEVRCISFQLSAASSATPSKAPAEVYTSPLNMAFQLNSIAFPLLQHPSHVCLNAVSYQIPWQAKYMYRILHRICKAILSNTIASLLFDGTQVLQHYFIIAFPIVECSSCSLQFSMTCKLNSITRRRLELQYRLRLNRTADHVMQA